MEKISKYITDKDIHRILKPYAYKAFKDLAFESHRVIDEFYRDYTPKMYSRVYGLKNLFSPTIKKIKKGYYIEFTYSADFITGEHRDPEAVFTGSFIYGWHGGKYAWGHEKSLVKRMIPSPWIQLSAFVKNYKF